MLYYILRPISRLAMKLYFRRIFLHGEESIPDTGACLFISNHPSSFLEACILASYQKRDLYFLVRGDLFEKKWLKPILTATNQIPIYRFKDGFSKLRDNKNTFDRSYEILNQQKTILIFPEASTLMVKYLRPLQKGAAKLLLGCFEQHLVEDISIIPIGMYYADATKSRRDVIMEFGKPCSLKKWADENQHGGDSIQALTTFLESQLQQVVPSIKHTEHEEIYNAAICLEETRKLSFAFQSVNHTQNGFNHLKKIISAINDFSKEKINHLTSLYLKGGLRKSDVRKYSFFTYNTNAKIFFTALLMLLSFIVGLPGIIMYALPLYMARLISYRLVKHVEFIAPVRIALSIGLFIIWSLTGFIIFSILWNEYIAFGVIIGLFISLRIYLLFMDWFQIILPFRAMSYKKKLIVRSFEKQLHTKDL